MSAGLAVRGPRTAATWTERHAALIQRTDQAWHGSEQPAVATADGRTVAAAVCDGYLKNAAGLRAAVGADATATGTPPSPAELILHAYLRWGAAVAEHLDGAFAFAIWDATRSELLLGRDRMGVKPLSWIPTADGALFASDLAVLAGHRLVTPELDADGVCAVVTQLRPSGYGALRGVREVPPAGLVRITADRTRTHRYWALEARDHVLDPDATTARADELLRTSVAEDIAGHEPAVLLSGGLDSSLLTGLVSHGTNRRAVSFTVAFDGTRARVPDLPFIEDVVRFWDCEHHDVLVTVADVCDPPTREQVLAAKDHPSPFGDKNVTPYLLARRAAERVPVALCGEAADTMFGGLYGELDTLRELRGFPWLEQSRRFGVPYGIGTGLFSGELLRSVDIDGYLERTFDAALAEVPTLPTDSPARRAVRQLDHLTTGRLLEQTMLHAERLGTAAGLQLRFPFADHALYSFMYNVPPELKFTGGRTKSQLRDIARDLVPPSVLHRIKSTYPATYDERYKAFLLDRLRSLLDDATAPVRPLLDVGRATAITEDPRLLDRGGWFGRADVEMILQADAWMRRLRVRLGL
ncbi:asparagine synthetase B family protein [Streptomyces sp. NPDC001606]